MKNPLWRKTAEKLEMERKEKLEKELQKSKNSEMTTVIYPDGTRRYSSEGYKVIHGFIRNNDGSSVNWAINSIY